MSCHHTLFHVIVIDYIKKNLDVIVIYYFEKNLDVIDYTELALKRGNPICGVTYYCLYSDKPVVLNLFAPWTILFKEKYLMDHFVMLTPHKCH